MSPPITIQLAVNRRRIPEKHRGLSNLQIFRLGFDTADIALFRHVDESSVSWSIHWLRERERAAYAKAG